VGSGCEYAEAVLPLTGSTEIASVGSLKGQSKAETRKETVIELLRIHGDVDIKRKIVMML
jgi:hypothetical protein